MKNVDEFYKSYFNVYKGDYDSDDELTKDRKKNLDYKQLELGNETKKRVKTR